MDPAARELAQLIIKDTTNNNAKLVQGVVAAVNSNHTVDVYLSGAEFAISGLRYFESYFPTVNDSVWVLKNGPDLLVLGVLANPSEASMTPAVPIGVVMPYGGTSAPSLFLLCDGAAVSRTTYAELFAVIGTAYGSGNGTTTFNVPDVKGRGPIGAGQGASLTNRTVGQKLGAETHVLTTTEIPSHVHTLADVIRHTSSGVANPGSSFGRTSAAVPPPMYPVNDGTGYAIWSRDTNSKGSDGAHNNMQPSTVFNFIIRAL